ncbi:MAG: hypothetical protein LBC23_00820 [Coriobacteriales bacterium]|jgi:hypothetical protein|nr:hypothetical protein [Coriobacteriales bacterium]
MEAVEAHRLGDRVAFKKKDIHPVRQNRKEYPNKEHSEKADVLLRKCFLFGIPEKKFLAILAPPSIPQPKPQ